MKQNNNIPQGYKDSLLGIIPKEWRVKRIRDILTEGKLGGNYENSGNNGGVPVIKMGNLDRGKINTEKIEYLPQDCTYSEDDILKKGDLLFNTRNSLDLVGKVAIWNNELLFAVYNSNILRLSFDTSYIHSNMYMNFVFNSHYGLSQLRKYATGTTSVAAIYSRDLYNMRIICPPLHEQQKIAETLSCWDFAIEKQTMLIKMLETRKRGLMQQLLTGKKRLKGFEEKWKKYQYCDILKSIQRNMSWNDGELYELISVKRRSGGLFLRESLYGHQIKTKKLRPTFEGDFLISKMQIVHGASGLTTKEFHNKKISDSYIAVIPRDKNILNIDYLNLASQMPYFYHQTYISSYGVHIEKMTFDFETFMSLSITLPSLTEQTAIANILSSADEEIRKEKQKLAALKEQKKGLMQVLLTGKKRVKI